MKNPNQYKRLIKFVFTFISVLLATALYWFVWGKYYNPLAERPLFRRGIWLLMALYAALLTFFYWTYGVFKVAYLKKRNLIWSQVLSLILVNAVSYIQISLSALRFHSPVPIAVLSFAQFFVVAVWTLIFKWIYSGLFPPHRMLLIYGNRPAFRLLEKLNSREDKYYLQEAMPVSEGVEAIMERAKTYDAVIIGDIPSHERNLLLKLCFDQGIRTYTVPKISDILLRSSDELDVFDSPLYLSRNEGFTAEQLFIKRLVDICLSAVGLVVTSPFFLVIAAAIKFTDPGPVFYRQNRLTKDGKVFRICKFRTMIQDAEKGTGARLAAQNDDRILPVGHFLRRTRLDELPQLWNILKGEMSLVGPRPERPELAKLIEEEIPEFSYRLKVKAGLTGYAQIYGKYNTTSYDKLKLDLSYIRNFSILGDFKLILMTPKIMFMKESTEGVTDDEEDIPSNDEFAAMLKKEMTGRNALKAAKAVKGAGQAPPR